MAVLLASGYNSYAQKVTLHAKSEKLVNILDNFEKQTDYQFLYSKPTVDPEEKYSISVKETELRDALKKLFKDKPISFDIKYKKVYLIQKKKEIKSTPVQTKTVSGTVTDEKGEKLPGVAILIKGSSKGTVTDENGHYKINGVTGASVLEFSMIGFATETRKVGTNNTINLKLQVDSRFLDEVVIVGYGSLIKANLTGSVATVTNRELADRPTTNIITSLQGLTPGLMITQGSGTPGDDGGTIRIRGVGTVNNASPYILVDGIETGTIDQIDPNTIESISVLKDASSAAIYGSKASNGVILITTKRGHTGKTTVSYNGNVSFSNVSSLVERLSSYDYARLTNELNEREGLAPQFTNEEIQKFQDGSDPDNYPNTDWNDAIYRIGLTHKHNVIISVGSEKMKYLISGDYLNQKGTVKNSDRQQFSFRTNIDAKVSEKLNLKADISFLENTYGRPNASYFGEMDKVLNVTNRIAPWIAGKKSDGTYGYITDGNPIAWIDANTRTKYTKTNFYGTIGINYELWKGLTLSVDGSYIFNLFQTKDYRKEVIYDPTYSHGPTSLYERKGNWNRKIFNALLRYSNTFGEGHNFKVLLGYNMERYAYSTLSGEREGFINTNLTDMDAGSTSTMKNTGFTRDLALMSYFGRINYDYKGRYLFEANFRSDASSRFAPDYRWGYFPSVSAGWRITEEPWMKSAKKYIQNIKIRGSWGKLGNQNAIAGDYFPYLPTLRIGKNFPFNGKVNTGITVVDHKVNSITWEKSRTYGFGLDVTFLKDFSVTLDYYDRLTTDMIMDIAVPDTFGISGTFQDNRGSMVNKGFEFSFSWQHAFQNDWRAGANMNYSFNRNKILDLAGVDKLINGYSINKVGEQYGAFYVYKTDGLFRSDEEAAAYEEQYGNPFQVPFRGGDLKVVDADGDGKLTTDDRIVTNSRYPIHTYAFGFNIGWKGLDLSIFFQGAADVNRFFSESVTGFFGGDTTHPSTNWLNAWTPDKPDATWPRAYNTSGAINCPKKVYSDFWCMDTSYLRLKTVNVSYTLPERLTRKAGIDKIKLYYAGENLHTFDNLPFNVDPEVPSGNMNYYPTSINHSIGINITF